MAKKKAPNQNSTSANNGSKPQDVVSTSQSSNKKPKKKHSFLGGLFKFLCIIVLSFVTVALFSFLYADCPNEAAGHKLNASTILIAGTDESGLRTDTLMLLSADRISGKLSLMSIPRDTKVDSTYKPHKINLAYQCNGAGEEGMYWLMDYVRQCVGFRPDGYVLIDLDCVEHLVDLFGGIDFEVPCKMVHSDPANDIYVDLEPGLQHLNGAEAEWVVRFRSGYAMADLERVRIQRNFIVQAIKQWLSVKNVTKFTQALDILEEYCLTDLSTRNFLWFMWSAVICGTADAETMTIPFYLSDSYVCINDDEDFLELINEHFNPYTAPVGFEDLNIAH